MKKFTATGKRRLLKLADMLEADAKNKKGLKFDLTIEMRPVEEFVLDKDGHFQEAVTGTPGLNCHTKGCAMGLAALSGEFKRAGLSYKVKADDVSILIMTWNGRTSDYERAAVNLFEIDKTTADFLFGAYAYRDKVADTEYSESTVEGAKGERRVAKRIRNLVAGKITTDDRYS